MSKLPFSQQRRWIVCVPSSLCFEAWQPRRILESHVIALSKTGSLRSQASMNLIPQSADDILFDHPVRPV